MKYLLFLFFTGNSLFCSAQISHINVLIGKTEVQVTRYLDSLNNLKDNSYYKIKRDVSETGGLILKVEFSMSDEKYYNCSGIVVGFQRFNGQEICINQMLWGIAEYAQSNSSYIKDNFEVVSDGEWEKPFGNSGNYKIVATFQRQDGNPPGFIIIYRIKSIK